MVLGFRSALSRSSQILGKLKMALETHANWLIEPITNIKYNLSNIVAEYRHSLGLIIA